MVCALCEGGWDAREAAGEANGDGKEERRVRIPQSKRTKSRSKAIGFFLSCCEEVKLALLVVDEGSIPDQLERYNLLVSKLTN